MQQSGQMIAHKEHPEQSASFLDLTGFTPLWLKRSSTIIKPLGQALIHKRQPLHFSCFISILAMAD
jgi:hypothetical protein